MKPLFIQYAKCGTCIKARKWLDAHGITYEIRDIITHNPSTAEIGSWLKASNLPIRKFFNTSGMLYKEMKLKEKLPTMSEDEQLQLLSTNGMLVKRPLVVNGDKVLVGFKEAEWSEILD